MTKAQKMPNPYSDKPTAKDFFTKIAPLSLIANVAAALVAIGLDLPIVDVKLDGDDLLITLYGDRLERFPLDYNLVIKIDKIKSIDDEDAPVRLAATVLGHDKNSPEDWTPDVQAFTVRKDL